MHELDRHAEHWDGCETQHGYASTPEGLIWHRPRKDGTEIVPLTNFDARIVACVREDDGVDARMFYEVEATLEGRLRRFRIPARQFGNLRWVAEMLGPRAIVYAGAGVKAHAPVAIQALSESPLERVVYGHTGWRRVTEGWLYLHAGGAIGAGGAVEGIGVSLSGAIAHYRLPDLGGCGREAHREAVRASLSILELAPAEVTMPLLASVYRSVLGLSDFSIHLVGPTGEGKSQLAALAQQHFGRKMDARNLPASWSSTANALEGLGFVAKDAVLVIDDFAPTGSTGDIRKFHRDADRVLRAQGNLSGRTRLAPDASLGAVKPPRGLIVSTGEEVPRGQSLRGRILILELSPGDLDWKRLTLAQRDAEAGKYSLALAGFLRWLARSYDTVQASLESRLGELRDRAAQRGGHRRTPVIVANLIRGLELFLDYARSVDAITTDERSSLMTRAWAALSDRAKDQEGFQGDSEPTRRFLDWIRAALASGKAHLATRDGSAPENATACGWRRSGRDAGTASWKAQGERIGWVIGDNLFLERNLSHRMAQALARGGGESVAVDVPTLSKRLREKGLLLSTDRGKRTHYVRKRFEGVDWQVLHLSLRVLGFQAAKDSDGSTAAAEVSGAASTARPVDVGSSSKYETGASGAVDSLDSFDSKMGA